jgi:hypothetical protein
VERRAAPVVCLINAKSQHLVKVVERYWLVALGRYMQTVETMLVLDHIVAALVNEHLADLDVTVERRVMDCREFFVACLPIDPTFYDIWIGLVLIVAQCSRLRNPDKLPEYHRLVLDGSMVEQRHAIIVLQRPYFNVLWQLAEFLLQLFDL